MSNPIHAASNSDADKQAVMKEAEDFGRREGGGAAARAAFYNTLTEWSQDDRLDVTDDADMWAKYSRGAAAGASMIGGTRTSEGNEDVTKVRISECRSFIKLGGLLKSHRTNGVEVLDNALKIIRQTKLDGDLKMKPTDAMLAVARAQCDDPGNPLDDDTIRRKIQPKPENEKTEADRLYKVGVELEAIIKKFGDSDEVNAARALTEQRINALGGTSAQIRAAKALAKKQAKGKV